MVPPNRLRKSAVNDSSMHNHSTIDQSRSDSRFTKQNGSSDSKNMTAANMSSMMQQEMMAIQKIKDKQKKEIE